MDKRLQDYLDCKKRIREYYMKAIRKVQKVEATCRMEEYIKGQFIKQLVNYQCDIRIYYYTIYERYVDEIANKLRKYIYEHDSEEHDEDENIKYYRVKLLDDIGHYYDYTTCACNVIYHFY
jgi:hypothetical protein